MYGYIFTINFTTITVSNELLSIFQPVDHISTIDYYENECLEHVILVTFIHPVQ